MLQTILADYGKHRPLEAGARVAYFWWDKFFPRYNTEDQNQSEKADPNRSRLNQLTIILLPIWQLAFSSKSRIKKCLALDHDARTVRPRNNYVLRRTSHSVNEYKEFIQA